MKTYSMQSFFSDQDEAAAINEAAKRINMTPEVYLRRLVIFGNVPRPTVQTAVNQNDVTPRRWERRL
jgi:hypothetical protein